MQLKICLALMTVVWVTGLSACYESADVTIYSPGEYKGASDPLLKSQRSAEQQQLLRERFNMVQTDR